MDGLGNPVATLPSPGNDSTHTIELMGMADIAGSNLLGDKAYGTKEILVYIAEHGATVVISPKSNAKEPGPVDYCLYKERHLVECFFQKSKWFRRVATRYDKLDMSFLAFVYMAAIMIWLFYYLVPFFKQGLASACILCQYFVDTLEFYLLLLPKARLIFYMTDSTFSYSAFSPAVGTILPHVPIVDGLLYYMQYYNC